MMPYCYLPAALRVNRVACLVGLFVIPEQASSVSSSETEMQASPAKRGRPVIGPIGLFSFTWQAGEIINQCSPS